MRKEILLITALMLGVGWGCGGEKFKPTSGGAEDEILFVNDTPNDYRITIVGTSIDFTLRAGTRKGVKVDVGEDLIYKINMERTKGDEGLPRYSELARGGTTVHIFMKYQSVYNREFVELEVSG